MDVKYEALEYCKDGLGERGRGGWEGGSGGEIRRKREWKRKGQEE